MWVAKEKVGLPVFDERGNVTSPPIIKNEGDTISKEEFDAAQQSNEDIANLVEGGAIEEEA